MNQNDDSFIGDRLTEAREYNELSQTKLAQLIDVQRQTISAIEAGKQYPSYDTALKLSAVLEFPFNFFFTSIPLNEKRYCPITFRGKANNTKRKKRKAELYDQWFVHIINYLSNYIEFPEAHICISEKYDYTALETDDIDEIANNIREKINLGYGPISDTVRLAESLGIFLGVTDLPIQIDAFSSIYESMYLIYMNYTENKAVRARFNLAHELGHIILHKNIDEEFYSENFSFIEMQANTFAGSFLLPRQSFIKEFYSLDMNSLLRIKERWKVSIQAIIMRARTLDIINENQYRNSFRRLNYAGYRTKEPLDELISVEKPTLLKKSIELLVSSKIKTQRQLIDEIGVPIDILAKLTDVDPDFFCNFDNILDFNLRIK